MSTLSEEQKELIKSFDDLVISLKITNRKKEKYGDLIDKINNKKTKSKSSKSSTEKKGRQVPEEAAKDNQGKVCKGNDGIDYIPVQNKAGSWCWRKVDKTSNASNASEEETKEEIEVKPIKPASAKANESSSDEDSDSEEEN
jgi:hypothetical protein